MARPDGDARHFWRGVAGDAGRHGLDAGEGPHCASGGATSSTTGTSRSWTVAAQLAQTTAESQSKRDQLQDELKTAQSGESRSGVSRAVQAAGRSRRQAAAGRGRKADRTTDFSELDAAAAALAAAPEGSDEAAAARKKLKDEMGNRDPRGEASRRRGDDEAQVRRRRIRRPKSASAALPSASSGRAKRSARSRTNRRIGPRDRRSGRRDHGRQRLSADARRRCQADRRRRDGSEEAARRRSTPI